MPSNERNVETGRQGGHVDTTGKPAQEKQQIDADVAKGRREANR